MTPALCPELTVAPRTILVGEDDDDARALVSRYLQGKGYRVQAVADGQAVLDTLARDPVDLVLLDVMMPKLSGFDVLEQARARGNATPIIMATAASAAEDIVRALSLGADDYLPKPFSFPVLLARIELRMRLRPRSTPEPDTVADSVADDPRVITRIKHVAERIKRGEAPALPQLSPGDVLAERYRIDEKIGEGGFGAVFRARHVDLGQDVALKVLHTGGVGALEGFRREAQNACRVRHPNAVRVYDFGLVGDGGAFIVMELLEGPTLEQVLRREGQLDVKRAAHVLGSVLSALSVAHKQGIIHRDVKAGNIVLHNEDGREVPKLVDFGIAKDVDFDAESAGVIIGSAAYIAPERLRDVPYDGRSDVYAVGILLYRLLCGDMPFDLASDNFEHLALWHLHERPPRRFSPKINDVIAKLTEKDPARRPTASEAQALLAAL